MKNVAEMKRRLHVGTRLLCVENTRRPELNGTERTIVKVQTNAIAWAPSGESRNSWTYWPGAKGFTFIDADTFAFLLDPSRPQEGRVTLRFLS